MNDLYITSNGYLGVMNKHYVTIGSNKEDNKITVYSDDPKEAEKRAKYIIKQFKNYK